MSAPTPQQGRLAHAPVVLCGGRWWLDGGAGSVPASDPAFTAVLDDFALSMAAADQAVANLLVRQDKASCVDPGGRR
ncbi:MULTISPECIES: hypothetical protein [Streptomyces]|uniref:Uncharacterized protein n=1 Tax=Streptomyces globisporus TaxID=1908 RepID=A0A423V7G0_STRGL|nr:MULTISPECIES: hypothetical protein [Streptomyces]MCX4775129.1 hypothetical protein [Streptomyces sp. NBC_01285]ROV70509.1 hypothetical protein D3105_00295 [Streptomyces globisporus]